jgi:hypothetical protein
MDRILWIRLDEEDLSFKDKHGNWMLVSSDEEIKG